jgi:hypothetical protein
MMRAVLLSIFCVWMGNSLAQTETVSINNTLARCPTQGELATASKIMPYQVWLLLGQKIIDRVVQDVPEPEFATEGSNPRPMLEAIQRSRLANKFSTRIAILASFSLSSQSKILSEFNIDEPRDWSLRLTEGNLVKLTDRFKQHFPHQPELEVIGNLFRVKQQSPYSTGAGGHAPLRGGQDAKGVPIYVDKKNSCWTTDKTKGNRVFNYDGFGELAMLQAADGTRICSAVLISSNMALTAVHCGESTELTIAIPKSPSCFARNSSTSSSVACAFETHKVTAFKHFKEPRASKTVIKINKDEKSMNDPDIKLVGWTSPSNLSLTFPRLVAIRASTLSPPYEFVRGGYGYTENGTATHLSIGFHSSHEKPQFGERPTDGNDPFGLMVLNLEGTVGSRICRHDSGGAVYMGNPSGYEEQRDLVGIVSFGQNIDSGCLGNRYEGHALITPAIKAWICNLPEMKKSDSCRP